MSSEMREYVAALRDREHRFHGMGGHYVAEVIRGELEALLARTEAGADGDKAGWQDGWPMAYHTRYRHVLEETIGQPFGEGTRLGSADIRRVAMAMAREFGVPTDTHPQDASGDAELIEAVGTYEEAVRLFGLTSPSASRAYCRMTDVLAAMQAKEAK